jgi:hypothetical protein
VVLFIYHDFLFHSVPSPPLAHKHSLSLFSPLFLFSLSLSTDKTASKPRKLIAVAWFRKEEHTRGGQVNTMMICNKILRVLQMTKRRILDLANLIFSDRSRVVAKKKDQNVVNNVSGYSFMFNWELFLSCDWSIHDSHPSSRLVSPNCNRDHNIWHCFNEKLVVFIILAHVSHLVTLLFGQFSYDVLLSCPHVKRWGTHCSTAKKRHDSVYRASRRWRRTAFFPANEWSGNGYRKYISMLCISCLLLL